MDNKDLFDAILEKSFSEKYSVSLEALRAYKEGIRTENLSQCAWAFQTMRRDFMSQLTKYTVHDERISHLERYKNELYSLFGDMDALESMLKERERIAVGIMEAGRKRAEEIYAKEKERRAELAEKSDETLDSEYFTARDNHEKGTMREIVNEFARRHGYEEDSDYQGRDSFLAPRNPGYATEAERWKALEDDYCDVNLMDIAKGHSMQDERFFKVDYIYNHPYTNQQSATVLAQAMDSIRNGNENTKVKVYRAVPNDIEETMPRNGDWVTPSKEYAVNHGIRRLNNRYKIIECEVPASHLWFDGNDINEWGYDDGKRYAYRNTDYNRKSFALETYDNEGSIIAPSKRFDINNADIRFRKRTDVSSASVKTLDYPSPKEFYERNTSENFNVEDPRWQAWKYMDRYNGNFDKALKKALKEYQVWMGIWKQPDNPLVKERKEVYDYLNDYAIAMKEAAKQQKAAERQEVRDKIRLLDKDYLKAVDDGDLAKAQSLVNEAANIAGYSDANDYRTWHTAPLGDDYNLMNISKTWLPEDFIDNPSQYAMTQSEKFSARLIASLLDMQHRYDARGKGEIVHPVIYRAVPVADNANETTIRNGDWVTLNRDYAVQHGKSNLNGKFRILSQVVPLTSLFWNGDSADELGYDDGKHYAYKDVRNNAKLLDPIILDERGKVIPLSKRFDERKADVRYRVREGSMPVKTQKAFKLFKVDEQGNPHPLFIDSKAPLFTGVWLDAESPKLDDMKALDEGYYLIEKDGKSTNVGKPTKQMVEQIAARADGSRYMNVSHYSDGSKKVSNVGINGSGSVSTFAMRPGWHITNAPSARHIGAVGADGKTKAYRRPDERWFEVEYAADKDYNEEARQSKSKSKGIDEHIPEDGFYEFKTNSNANPNQTWIISGAMRILRPLSESEARSICRKMNIEEDLPYKDGKKTFKEYDQVARQIEGNTLPHLPQKEVEYAMREVQSMASKLHLPVVVHRDGTGMSEEYGKSKGWYDGRDNTIKIILGNHDNVTDIQQTMLHEGVAHYGLRKMFGEHFDTFLDNVYNNVTPEIRQTIDDMAKDGKMERREATEEYMAQLAEKTDFENVDKGLWATIKGLFIEALSLVGFKMDKPMTDNELRYILSKSYDNLKVLRKTISPEELAIMQLAKLDGTYMKAPNGERSNLSERQWLQVRTKAFKDWFGDWEKDPKHSSKVVDENGEPLVVYHGTRFAGFTVFDKSSRGIFFSSEDRASWYATGEDNPRAIRFVPKFDNWEQVKAYCEKHNVSFEKAAPKEYEEGVFVIDKEYYVENLKDAREYVQGAIIGDEGIGAYYPVFLNARNPRQFSARGKSALDIDQVRIRPTQDGVICKNVFDPTFEEGSRFVDTNYVVYSPNQIKSALDNDGTFLSESNDIRFRKGVEASVSDNQKITTYDAMVKTFPREFFTLCRKGDEQSLNDAKGLLSGYLSKLDTSNKEVRHSLMATWNTQMFLSSPIKGFQEHNIIADGFKAALIDSGIDKRCFLEGHRAAENFVAKTEDPIVLDLMSYRGLGAEVVKNPNVSDTTLQSIVDRDEWGSDKAKEILAERNESRSESEEEEEHRGFHR